MGVERYLLSSSLLGVLAQRLVRKLCPACRKAYHPSAGELAELDARFAGETLFSAVGCPQCNGTGYSGRTGIYELLAVDEDAKRLIHQPDSESQLRQHAARVGMRDLRSDSLRWLLSGATSLEEIIRVTAS
jgi:general secretion pathway protein E